MPSPYGQVGTTPPDTETAALIDAVWGRLQARLERGLTRIERHVSSLFDRPLEPSEVLEAIGVGDLVAAKLGLLGLGTAAELVRRAVLLLEGPELGVAQAIALSSLLDDVRSSIATTVSEIKVLSHSGPSVAVIGAVSESVDELLWVSAAQGMPVAHHVDGAPDQQRDVAVVLVVVDDPDLSRTRPLVRGIRESHPMQPILAMVPEDGMLGRASMVDMVTTILPRSLHPLEVVTELRRAVARSRHQRSLSVFGANAQLLAEPLWRRGLAAKVESDIDVLMERLGAGDARAVVVMPDTGALRPEQVLRLIRTDRRTRSAVVIMVCEGVDSLRTQTLLRDGADDVFGPSVDPDDLAIAIKARLTRRSELEPVEEVGGHRGTVPWSTATLLIERMLLVAFRRSTPVGFAVVRLENTGTLDGNDLDEAIAREFRGEDVIGRLDEQHLVLALPGVTRRTMLGRVADLQQKFDIVARGARAVALEFPLDGRSLAELVEQGCSSIQRSIDEHGPWLVGADWRPWSADAADVMLVDPDVTLGSVLAEVLGRRGLSVIHRADALKALDELTGRTPLPMPRLVLMDLDQRGIDGFQFLRQLRAAGVLHRCRVVVLSARATESDLRLAFELGAEDYVTKPFSTPLLVHRLTRALAP